MVAVIMGLANNVLILLATIAITSILADTDITKAPDATIAWDKDTTFCPVPIVGTRYDE
jgi:hypothetical protein